MMGVQGTLHAVKRLRELLPVCCGEWRGSGSWQLTLPKVTRNEGTKPNPEAELGWSGLSLPLCPGQRPFHWLDSVPPPSPSKDVRADSSHGAVRFWKWHSSRARPGSCRDTRMTSRLTRASWHFTVVTVWRLRPAELLVKRARPREASTCVWGRPLCPPRRAQGQTPRLCLPRRLGRSGHSSAALRRSSRHCRRRWRHTTRQCHAPSLSRLGRRSGSASQPMAMPSRERRARPGTWLVLRTA